VFRIPSHDRCPFCDYLSGATPCAFVTQERTASAFMNRAQYEKGAVLLVPNRHRESILDLDRELMGDLGELAQRVAAAAIRAFGAVGLNVFQNNGVQAGQTIAHYHVHLVPRYPHSESHRIFREEEYPHAPFELLQQRAAALRKALP